MGMQKRTEQGYAGMPDRPMPGQITPMGPGGNSCLTNQDEAIVTACAWEDVPIMRHEHGNYTVSDEFGTVQGVYREPEVI